MFGIIINLWNFDNYFPIIDKKLNNDYIKT
jgi:hypothetical protein